MTEPAALPRRLRAFLCHSSGDKDVVRTLSSRLERPAFHLWLIGALLVGVIGFMVRDFISVTSRGTSTMRYNLGLTLANDRKYTEAETEFREALKITPRRDCD